MAQLGRIVAHPITPSGGVPDGVRADEVRQAAPARYPVGQMDENEPGPVDVFDQHLAE